MRISKDITIGEVVSNYPHAVKTLNRFGVDCNKDLGGPTAQTETLEEACKVHGLDVEQLIKALNEA